MMRKVTKHCLVVGLSSVLAALTSTITFAADDVDANGNQKQSYTRPPMPAPKDNQITPERVELGKHLFFDPRLSGSNWISCATCHNPTLGWSDGLPTAIGHGMKVLGRATPTILNTGYQRFQFWDGRVKTLEEQALGPIIADGEMAGNLDEIIAKLTLIKGYQEMFEKAYPGEGLGKATMAKALASFERSIVATEAPFDRFYKGDQSAISDSAKKGFELFKGKANCAACHQNHNFSDDGFHNVGLKGNQDVGRFAKVPINVLKGAFKTPTLRDVALTAPYMHNGLYKTLAEVVEHYDRGGDGEVNDPNMKKLNLTADEKKHIVAFLHTLTGVPAIVTVPHLPQ